MSVLNQRVCFFIGAGASVPFNYPTTAGFLKILNETDSISNQEFWAKCYKNLYSMTEDGIRQFDIELLLKELEEYENFLAELLDQDSLKKRNLFGENTYTNVKLSGKKQQEVLFEGFCKEQRGNIRKLRVKIYHLIYETYAKDKEATESFKETYKHLFNKFVKRCDIFTTNYDSCIENAFLRDKELKSKFTDGFQEIDGDFIFNDSFFQRQVSGTNYNYRLFKLHGSVNWKRDPNNPNRIFRQNLFVPSELDYYLMIYPGTKKIEGYPFKEMYEHFRKELTVSKYCVIIGFSFRDDYINEIFEDTLNENDIRYLIWNPDKHLEHNFPEDRVIRFPYNFTKANIDLFLNTLQDDYKSR